MSNDNYERTYSDYSSSSSSSSGMWRSTVASASSSRLSSLKNLVPATQRDAMRAFFDRRVPGAQDTRSLDGASTDGQDRKMTWREWAGDKIRVRGRNVNDVAVERVSLFPGWAARRYHDPDTEGKEAAEFSLELFVSGFAASYVPPEYATRSQRAFMRLAKAYAALPKLPTAITDNSPYSSETSAGTLSRSTEELLKTVKLPPTPSNITEESEIAALEKQFHKAELDVETESLLSSTESDRDSAPSSLNDTPPSTTPISSSGVSLATAQGQFSYSLTELTRLHENLHARLQPFWSRALPNRTLRLSVFAGRPRASPPTDDEESSDNDDPTQNPIYVHHMQTDARGSFETNLRIPWKRICEHPGALQLAFGGIEDESELFLCAELLPPPNPVAPYAELQQEPTARTVLPVTLSHTQVRLISDVDDTIKLSNILGGARTVFQNVFVKHLEELVIQGMGEWYTRMWSRGVRFHYVSNSPFELLPVVNEFIRVSNLPRGSVKLKSYAGRSLFNGLLSAPAVRKRAGIVEILNAFSSSRFILVGDSGEQDLELYASVAAERHSQVLAVFIRDARGSDEVPLSDPTGEEIKKIPPPSRVNSQASEPTPMASMVAEKVVQRARSNTLPDSHVEATPTQKSYAQLQNSEVMDPSRNSSSYYNPSGSDYYKPSGSGPAYAPAQYPTYHRHDRKPGSGGRSSSAPVPAPSNLGLPSTFFDSGLTIDTSATRTSSPSSSRPASPASSGHSISSGTSVGIGLQFPGSLSESEISALPPAEKKRYKLQERVYRARLQMPSHIPLRVFMDPQECVEADRILDEVHELGSALYEGKQ